MNTSKAEMRRKTIVIDIEETKAQIVKSSYTFYVIVGLSVVNSICIVFDQQFSFAMGLGITQIIDAVMIGIMGEYSIFSTIINLFIAGGFVFLALKAREAKSWAFLTGLVLYGLDALLFLYFQIWMSVIIHGLIMYSLYKGYTQVKTYDKLLEEQLNLGYPEIGSEPLLPSV